MNLFDLTQKTILLTGGCGVLGGGIAKYLLENKATVILLHYKEATWQHYSFAGFW